MPQSHVNDEVLDQYAVGRLAAERLADVEEHLLECHSCQTRLEASDEFARLFRAAATEPDARPARGWRAFWTPSVRRAASWPVAAAAVAMTVLFVVGPLRNPAVAPATVLMQSLRGPESPAQVAAGKPAFLVFDIAPTADEAQYEARIVSLTGAQILSAKASLQEGRLSVLVDSLPSGTYWVRVYRADDREPVAEYGLQAR